jgi:hypothetical protein
MGRKRKHESVVAEDAVALVEEEDVKPKKSKSKVVVSVAGDSESSRKSKKARKNKDKLVKQEDAADDVALSSATLQSSPAEDNHKGKARANGWGQPAAAVAAAAVPTPAVVDQSAEIEKLQLEIKHLKGEVAFKEQVSLSLSLTT